MPPKRGRSGQTMAAANLGWEDGLRTAPFEEGSWRACVSLVVGGAPADEELMGALQQAVQQPQRRLFTLLSRAAVESTIHDLGNPKAKRPKDLPMFYEVTETAKLLLDAGEDVPCELMAFVLKFQMLQVKASDEHRRAGRQGSEDTAQSKAGPASASKRKPPENKAQKGVAPEAPGPEKQTQLKRRGEVVQSIQYIDDEPEDGPQHYILLTGFHQAQLLPALEALGVAVDHVIKVEREHAPEDRDPSGQGGERPGAAQQLEGFWSTLGRVLEGGPARSKLHDLARLSLTVGDRFNDPGATLALGGYIFEGVACLIYAWLAQQREHQNYLEHLHLTTIPTVIDESVQNSRREDAPKVLSRDVDMRYYDNLLEQLPPEACSVPVILHCMLEQVDMFPPEEGESVAEPELPPTPPGLHRGLARCLLEKVLPLARSQEERRRMLEHLLPEEERRRTLEHLLPEEERRRTLAPGQKHSKAPHGLDPMLVEGSMLQSAPVWRLIGSAAQRGTSRTTAAFKQQLLHYCTSEEASSSTVERLLHCRLLESMPLAAVDQQGALIRNGTQQPQPPPGARPAAPCPPATDQTFVTQEPDVPENTSSLLEKLDIFQKGRLRSFSEHRYAEHHNPNVFPQVLQAAMDAALCLDSFQSPLDQTLYVVCHSPRSSQKRCHESWDSVLHTDVAFRKYQEHVANVISDWTRLEGTKREAEQTRNMRLLEPPHDAPPAPEESPPEPSPREDSLKAWKLDQEQRQQEAEPGEKGGREGGLKRGPSSTAAGGKTSARSRKQETTGGAVGPQDQPPGGPTAGPPTAGPHEQTLEPPTTGPPTAGPHDQTAGPPTTGPPTAGPQDQPPGGPTAEAPAGPHDQPPGPHDQPPGPHDQPPGPQDPAAGCPPSPVFRGYRMDGQLVHVSGRLQHLFPSDGGRVTVHRVRFVQGSSLIQVAVKKDGHHFITHRVEAEQPPLEEDLGPPGSHGVEPQGSFSALLDNGVRLSFRYEGKAGKHTTDPVCPQEGTQDSPGPPGVPPGSPCCPGGLDLPAGPTSAEERSQYCLFNSLHLSAADGWTMKFFIEDAPETPGQRTLLVRQSIPAWQDGVAVAMPAERSRVITGQGAVVRHMTDGSTEVLFPDGAVSFSPDSGPVWPPLSERQQEEAEVNTAADGSTPPGRGRWVTTTPSGARVCTVGSTHEHIPTAALLSVHATDPLSQAVMLTRQDRMVRVQEPDGTLTVEHADGTRITSFYQGKNSYQESSYQGGRGPGGDSEEEEAGPVERVVLVEKDGSAQVMVFPERSAAHVFLADGTVVTGDGCGVYQVFPSKAGRLLIGQDGTCIYYPDSTPSSPGSQSGSYRLSTTHGLTCDVTDPEGNRFQVQQSGQVSVVLSAASRASEEEDLPHGEHSPRLFLVHEDGSGTELLHCEEAEPLLKMAPSGPAQLAKVRPAHPPKRDRRIVPLNLRDRSWLNFPITEMKTLGPPFGSDLGRGLALREGPPVQAPQVQDSPSPPQILQVHELVVYPPPCKRLRETLDSRLEGFRQRLLRREQLSEDMRPLQKIPDAGWERHQRTAAPDLHSDSPEESSRKESERPTETPWAQRRAKHRLELAEDRAQRAALRSRQVVSYFHPENVLLHQKSPT